MHTRTDCCVDIDLFCKTLLPNLDEGALPDQFSVQPTANFPATFGGASTTTPNSQPLQYAGPPSNRFGLVEDPDNSETNDEVGPQPFAHLFLPCAPASFVPSFTFEATTIDVHHP